MNIKPIVLTAGLALAAISAVAQTQKSPEPSIAAGMQMSQSAAGPMTEGEVRKIDKENGKVTLKHGEIKNLDMPGMTMVFKVKDPAMLEKLQTGEKVRFSAEKANGALVVTEIQPAQ